MVDFSSDVLHEFRRHKLLAENAMRQLTDDEFFRRVAPHMNSVAIIVKHLAGNLRSRWTDFLTVDGEKPNRNRDDEFIITTADTRVRLLAAWEEGWKTVLVTVESLDSADLDRSITIRGEQHTVVQALLRGLTHVAYHVGQIMYLSRLLEPEGTWLTIAPGTSAAFRGEYRKGGDN